VLSGDKNIVHAATCSPTQPLLVQQAESDNFVEKMFRKLSVAKARVAKAQYHAFNRGEIPHPGVHIVQKQRALDIMSIPNPYPRDNYLQLDDQLAFQYSDRERYIQ
jgi:hypothetical protein